MILVRKGFLGALVFSSLCAACEEPGEVPRDPSPADAGAKDPPLFTLETLGGTLYTPANASVSWARTFPGATASPPDVKLGPGDELIAQIVIERRPRTRLLSDYWLMRFDAGTGELAWMQTLETYGQVELDSQGNILFASRTSVKKLDPNGKLLWSKTFTWENTYPLLSIGIDGSDNVLVLEQDLDATAPNSSGDAKGPLTLEKLDPEGTSVWSHRIGTGAIPFDGAYVAADRADNVLVLTSMVREPVDFGGGPLSGDAVLAKYDPEGEHVFSKSLALGGPITYPVRNPVLTDATGNIFVTSPSFGDIETELGTLFCGGNYVLKFDPTGAPLWNVCATAGDLTLAADGGYLTSATLREDQHVGEKACTVDSEGSEGAVARYDASGQWLTTACAADPGYQYFGHVADDPSGAVFMAAAFGGQVTLPDGNAVPALNDGGWSALVAKVHLPK